MEVLQLSLDRNPRLEPAFATPQSCYLWPKQSDRVNWKLMPGTPAVCRLEDGRRFLWRLYPKLDRNSTYREAYFAQEAIELTEGTEGEEKPISSSRLVEVCPLRERIADFEKVTLDVQLDCSRLNVELLLTKDCVCDMLGSMLLLTFFVRGSRLDFSFLQERNLGISAAFVKDTQGPSKYGEIGKDTKLEIHQILFHPVITKSTLLKPLGGIDSALQQLEEALSERSSILISGPSGTGKYSLVKSLAREQNIPLFELRGLNFVRSLPGETEAELRKTFHRLQLFAELTGGDGPIVLLVKDIDTICPKIGGKKGEDMANVARIASQFVSLVDEYRELMQNLIIIGTTSMVENMDNRLRRPGRLGREITIGIPSKSQRVEMLRCFNAGKRLSEQQLDEIAFRTAGYVGAELELLFCNVARALDKQLVPFEEVLAEVQKKHVPSSLRNATGLIGRDLSLSLDSFAGLEELKSLLRLCVIEQLRNPDRFQRLGIHPLKGILLYGPPGCAKTTLAKCLAAESGMTFLSLSAAELYSPYVGDAEKLVTRVFNEARANAPSIVFLDEIDSLVGNRGAVGLKGAPAAVNMGILSTLLMEMDGIGQANQTASALSGDAKRVVVIAATNRPDMIDDALLRPGRLTKLIHVPAPDEKARIAILSMLGKGIPFAADVDVTLLAAQTDRYSGADLTNLCTQAALAAATENLAAEVVSMSHFKEALNDVRPSLTKEQIAMYYNYEANRER